MGSANHAFFHVDFELGIHFFRQNLYERGTKFIRRVKNEW